jgi:hypothetical protein
LQTVGVHKSRGASSLGNKILSRASFCLLVIDTELASFQASGAKNFLAASRFWKICAFLVEDISIIYLIISRI